MSRNYFSCSKNSFEIGIKIQSKKSFSRTLLPQFRKNALSLRPNTLIRMSENKISNDYTDLRLIHTSRYGNSRVFTANFHGKKVIVKTLKKEYVDDPACLASLKQEFETTSMLDNKYIRKVMDFVHVLYASQWRGALQSQSRKHHGDGQRLPCSSYRHWRA